MADLTDAITLLVLQDRVHPVYKVVAPTNHVLVDGEFERLEDIPDELRDTDYDLFDTSEGDVVRVYLLGK